MTTQSSDAYPSPYAAIDIGTNTIRLLIGCLDKGNLIRCRAERAVTRLGRDLTKYGILNKDSIDNTIRSLIQFKSIIDQFKAQKTIAIGTSALRDARNSQDFIAAVKSQTGIDVTIISGNKEADLTLKGVLGHGCAPKMPVFITDLGGGSTEWIFCNGDANFKGSVQIGAVRLYEQFIRSDPPAPEEIDHIRNQIVKSIQDSFRDSGVSSLISEDKVGSFIATGGTATTVAAIDIGIDTYDGDRIHLHKISYPTLDKLFGQLSLIAIGERANVPGLEPGRADIIIPGILILLMLMETLKADTLTISDYGLLEGILLSQGEWQMANG